MKTEHLKNFITIVDCGTITEASRQLCIAQPALSSQVKALENRLGACLFDRSARRLELTAAGDILYEKAKTILSVENSAYLEIEECISGSRGTLHLGITPSYPDPLFTKLLVSFHRTFTDISFDLYEVHSEQMLHLLRDGIIDVAVIRVPGNIPSYLDTWYRIQEQLCVTYSPDTNWFPENIEAVTIPMLQHIPLSTTKGFCERITSLCEDNGFSPEYFSICSSRVLSRMWADEGAAAVILSEQPGAVYPGLLTKPLYGTNTLSNRAIVTKKDSRLSAVTKAFLSYCQNWFPPVKNI